MLNTVEEGLEDIRQGKVLIVVDDEDRENEGDFLSAAELTTPEIINFMTIHTINKAKNMPYNTHKYYLINIYLQNLKLFLAPK